MNKDANNKEQQLIEELNKARIERETKCLQEVQEILKKYNCDVHPSHEVVINGERVGVKLSSK